MLEIETTRCNANNGWHDKEPIFIATDKFFDFIHILLSLIITSFIRYMSFKFISTFIKDHPPIKVNHPKYPTNTYIVYKGF